MKKHTQGPWLSRKKYWDSKGNYTPYVSAGDTAQVLFFMNLSGAYNGYEQLERAEADARLAAEAPRLLEELQRAIAMLRKPPDVLTAWAAHTATELEGVVADALGVSVWDLPTRKDEGISA